MQHALRTADRNQLLAGLPPADVARLGAFSRIEHPRRGSVLARTSEPGVDIWFPHTGTIALITTDASGRSVQTGMVGPEGCVGLQALFGPKRLASDAVVQIEGAMSVISATHLKSAFDARPQFQVALLRFLYGLSAQSLQTIACNRLHSQLSRCCRWLLTIQERVGSRDISITQEHLAMLIGGGRPRVNRLLRALEDEGILRLSRGRIRLLSRAALQLHSCECYRLSRDAGGLLAGDSA